jgi:hypothetical protein
MEKEKKRKKVRSREMKLISLSLSMVFSKILHSLTIIKNKNEPSHSISYRSIFIFISITISYQNKIARNGELFFRKF